MSVTGPQFDPRPGDTAWGADGRGGTRPYTVRARRGDVVDLDHTPWDDDLPHGGGRVVRHGAAVRVTGLALDLWAAWYHDHARRDPTTDPRAGDVLVRPTYGGRVAKMVVEGVDTEGVWARNCDNGDLGQTRVRHEDWATWVLANGLEGTSD